MKKIKKLNNAIVLKGGLIYDLSKNKKLKADILIKDGKIKKIGKFEYSNNLEIIDCEEKIITHGFTDIHAHFRQPGREDKETIKSGCLSALAGGYTRVCTMPNTNPVIDTPELIKFIKDESDKLPVNIYPIGSITKGQKGKELSEIHEMFHSGAIAISDDGIPLQNSKILRYALEYCKMIDIPIINHAEDIHLCSDGLMNEGVVSTELGIPGNPDISESTMVYRDLSIAEYTGGKIHIPHVSSEKTVRIIKEFKQKGTNVTAEVTPHHLVLTEEILKDYNTNAKVAPPIRTEKDRQALVKGLQSGIIDCIGTDHAPHTIEEKEVNFQLASCGMIGLESAFSLVSNEMKNAGSSIEDILKWFTINPNKIMGLINSDFEIGSVAELNIIDLDKKWILTSDNIYSKSKNTPFLEKELTSSISHTISNGYIFANHLE